MEDEMMAWRKSQVSHANGNCVETGAWRKSRASFANHNCVEVGAWRKTTYSTHNGACIEVGGWRKSERSTPSSNCVEVGQPARTEPVIGIRDTQESTHPYRVTLEVPVAAWLVFGEKVKGGWQPA